LHASIAAFDSGQKSEQATCPKTKDRTIGPPMAFSSTPVRDNLVICSTFAAIWRSATTS